MGVQFPLAGKLAGRAWTVHANGLTGVAPPAVRSASVTRPAWTFFTRMVFAGSIRQTLASYVSMHVLPTLTESGGHLSMTAWLDNALAIQTTAARVVRRRFMARSSQGVVSPPLYARVGSPDAGVTRLEVPCSAGARAPPAPARDPLNAKPPRRISTHAPGRCPSVGKLRRYQA